MTLRIRCREEMLECCREGARLTDTGALLPATSTPGGEA